MFSELVEDRSIRQFVYGFPGNKLKNQSSRYKIKPAVNGLVFHRQKPPKY